MPSEPEDRTGCIIVKICILIFCVFCLAVSISGSLALRSRAAMTKAEAEISSLETALTAALADSGLRDFRGLFDEQAFDRAMDIELRRVGADEISARIAIHSAVVLALLKHGNNAPEALTASEDTKHLANVIPYDVLRRFGNSYASDLLIDPWGNPYRFFLGPWRDEFGTIVFRTRHDISPEAKTDRLTATLPNSGNLPIQVGFPSSPTKVFYIWSLGQNEKSDQAIFDPTGEYAAPASKHYRRDTPSEFMGGGDDINNWDDWDNGRSYERLYQ